MKFKTEESEKRFTLVCYMLQKIAREMDQFCKDNFGFEILITETMTTWKEDEEVGRISKSHQEGRAIDIRNFDWTGEQKEIFINHFEERFKKMSAISKKTGKPNLIEDKEHGTGPHFHVQIRRGFE
jgi:hypothetical protein